MSTTATRAAFYLAGLGLGRAVFVVSSRCDDGSTHQRGDSSVSAADTALQTASRLRKYVVIDGVTDSVDFRQTGNLRLVETNNSAAIKVYQPRGMAYNALNYHKIIRVATTEVNGSVASIESKWLDQQDSFVKNTKMLMKDGKDSTIYHRIYRSVLVPARDFVYRIDKFLGGSIIGTNSFNNVVFVSSSSFDKRVHPRSWTMVRADYSSILLIEPTLGGTCTVTYIVEVDPKGWLTVTPFTEFVHVLVGNDVVKSLGELKRLVESQTRSKRDAENSILSESVESIVQRKINQDKKIAEDSLVSNVAIIFDKDILLTIQKMESRLHQIEKDEARSKLDMSDLKRRITKDIAALREQYNSRRH